MLSLIVAFTDNRVIGAGNTLPWKLPSDMKNFKNITTGKTVVMGRKTFESIGKPLTNRFNVVISTNNKKELMDKFSEIPSDQLWISNSLSSSLDHIQSLSDLKARNPQFQEFIFIGGSQIYENVIPVVDRMYISRIQGTCSGDTFFPEFNENEWKVVATETITDEKSFFSEDPEKKPLTYNFQILERLK